MRMAAATALAALLAQGCAAIPAAVAIGAMGVSSGDATSDRAAAVVEDMALGGDEGYPPSAMATDIPLLGVLPAQDLAPGACALFLFSRGGESRFVAFADADGQALTLNLDGETRTLRSEASRAPDPDRFAQTYRLGDGLEARLNATLSESLPQGRRAPEASLRMSLPGGAAQVTPLSGLLACEPEA